MAEQQQTMDNTAIIKVVDRVTEDGRTYRVIRLENPQRANCLSIESMELMKRTVREVRAAVVILTAEGSSFCSGLDLDEILERGTPAEHLHGLRDLLFAVEECDATTVSLVEGTTVAGGIALACCTDVALARAGVLFRTPSVTAYTPMVTVLKTLVTAYRPDTDFDALIGGQPADRSAGFIDGTIPLNETDPVGWAIRVADRRSAPKRRTSETWRHEIDSAIQKALAPNAVNLLLGELRRTRKRS